MLAGNDHAPQPDAPDPFVHPHAGFQYMVQLLGRATYYRHATGPLIEYMGAYIRAMAHDDRFEVEWDRLVERVRERGGISVTGLSVGMPRQELRIRQFELIVRAARWYHILEAGDPKMTPTRLQEKLSRIRRPDGQAEVDNDDARQ